MKPVNFKPTKYRHCGLYYVELAKRGTEHYKRGLETYVCRVCGEVVRQRERELLSQDSKDFNKMTKLLLRQKLKKNPDFLDE